MTEAVPPAASPDWLGRAAEGLARGAAAGSVVPGVGTAIGAAGGLALALAPEIGRHLFGPDAVPTVAAVAKAVEAATGTADPAEQITACSDPATAAELRVRLAEIAAARAQAEDAARGAQLAAVLADVADARKRDLALAGAGKRNIRADIMLVMVTVGLLACIVAAATGRLGDTAVFGMVSAIAGMLSGCFKDAFGFEFGSTRGSEAKTAIIADMAQSTVPASLLPKPSAVIPASDVKAAS